MGFIKRQLLKIIQWKDATQHIIVHRYEMTDRDEIMNGCQLVVQESQVAILAREGQFADVFGPGTHRLETKNLPILSKLAGWKYGFESPFKADVYYINTKQFINQTWGTSNPVMMRDADFGMIRVRAYGKYSFQVDDAPTLIRELVGTNGEYTIDNFRDHAKTMFVTSFSDALAESRISALDMAMKYEELSEHLKNVLDGRFKEMGLKVTQAYVENVSLPEEVEKAIDKRTSLGVLSDKMGTYVAMETVGAMRDAANNPNGNSFAGAGVGIGAGVTMGHQMVSNLNNIQDTPRDQPKPAAGGTCPKCGSAVPAGSKFCPECGEKMPTAKFCPECGTKLDGAAKFCPECGTKLN